MRVLVLGGYGAMGTVTSTDLVLSGVEKVFIAGRDLQKAKTLSKKLGGGAVPARIDVQDKNLAQEIRRLKPDVLVNATWYEHNMLVMGAAIRARTHYVDLGGLYHMTKKQLKLDKKAKKAGVLCLLGIGSTPGTTNIMAGYGARKFDKLEKVEIRSGWRVLERTKKPIIPFSARTIYDEFTLPAPILRKGKIKLINPKKQEVEFSFPKLLGKVSGHISIHSELATLPKTLDKGVSSMDFSVAYPSAFHKLVDKTIVKFRKKERAIEELQKETVQLERDPIDIDGQRVELWGTGGGKKLRLRLDSITTYNKNWGGCHGSDMDTGIPPSIAAQWIAAGKLEGKGVLPPERAFSGLELYYFRELFRRGGTMRVFEFVNGGRPRPLWTRP